MTGNHKAPDQPDDVRAAFEKWWPTTGRPLEEKHCDFYVWEAAWNARVPKRESGNFVDALAAAQKVVEAYPLYRKFIDGTPLQNDIAVWMAEFAVNGGKP